MNLQDAVDALARVKPVADMPAALAEIPQLSPTKAEITDALMLVKEQLAANNHNLAAATTLALLRWDADNTIARLRKESVLRASTYEYRSNGILKLVRTVLDAGPSVGLSPERVQYLKSVAALQTLAPQARQLRKSLLGRLKLRKRHVLKTLLVVVNEFFSQEIFADRGLSSDAIRHWMPEEISEAFSAILELFRSELGPAPSDWTHTDERFVGAYESIYEGLLLDAARLNTLREAETMVDGLPYFARVEGDDVVVASIDAEFEKSVRLGYIQADQQTMVRVVQLTRTSHDEGWAIEKIREFMDACYDAGLDKFVFVVPEPVRRLVFRLPDVPPLLARLASDAPFLEEVAAMYGAGIEAFKPEAGAALEVAPGLTAMDVCKVQRFFLLLDVLYHRKLDAIEDETERESLRVRSVIPVMRRPDLKKMLDLALAPERAERMLQFLTLSPNTDHVDLQYRPFIQAGDWFAFAPAVVGKSNLMRNIVTANSLHTTMKTMDDPMEAAVVDALKRTNFTVERNFIFNISGKRETDIFAWKDGKLFVFECKNAFHPCNPHELRNSFDHVQKAEEQLDIRLGWLQDGANQARLFAALSWNVAPTKEIYTAVITANRAFSGYRKGKHPVRQAHEFINVLLRGTVNRFDGGGPVRFWKGERFAAEDLIEYLAGRSILETQYSAMEPSNRRVRLGHKGLVFESFAMDPEKAVKQLDVSFVNEPQDAGSGSCCPE